MAEVLSYSDYYPFGMEMPGRNGSTGTYRFGYQGSEKDNEVKGEGNSYTTLYRQLDSRLGKWLSVDPKSSSMPWQSPYISMDGNPIINTDVLGDSIWTTTKNDITTLHFRGKVINNSTNDIDMEESIKDIKEDFIDTYSGVYIDEAGKEMNLEIDIELEAVTSLNQVDESDHLLVFTDVEHEKGNARGVVNEIGGKIAYLSGKDYPSKNSWFGISYTNTAIHEMGHLLGEEHTNRFNNLMNVGASGYSIRDDQRSRIVQNRNLNRGKPFLKIPNSIRIYNTTINYHGSYGDIMNYGHRLKKYH